MGLATYRKKRRFGVTPEPPPKLAKSESGRSFVVQKHAASRLHYDFRLELDGTLKSWAVPKGPSLDPGEKRLAVAVEDHPIAYRTFEGIIPAGEYGGGTVIVWDDGTWEPIGDPRAGLEKGHLAFRLHGEKLRGRFDLVRTGRRGNEEGKTNWLLIKQRDDEARPGTGMALVEERPESVKTGRTIEDVRGDAGADVWRSNREAPRTIRAKVAHAARMGKIPRKSIDVATIAAAKREKLPEEPSAELATLVSHPPSGDDWLHEVKFDGYRALARIDRGKVTLLTRRGQDWTDHFPTIARALADLPVDSAILDGEVVALRPDGTSDFQALQNAIGRGGSAIAYYAFDLLHLDGKNVRPLPLLDRKEALRAVLAKAPTPIRLSEHVIGNGEEVHAQACKLGLEGIVSKKVDSHYVSGRGKEWLKTKCTSRQELVVGGFTEPEGSRNDLGALLLGVREGDELVYVGKVGTGFDHAMLRELRKRLEPLEQAKSPFRTPPKKKNVHWVKPKVVVEVEFTAWTNDGKLRHPSFRGIREDKAASEVVREKPKDASVAAVRASHATPASKSGRGAKGAIDVAGVRITNASKVLYAEQGVTKGEIAEYYEKVKGLVVPYVAGRPLTLVRCPDGPGKHCFYQKHVADPGPAIRHVKVNPDEPDYLYVEDLQGVLGLLQMGVLEIHVWGSRVKNLEKPDLFVMDLDPDEGLPWARVVEGAREMKAVLDALELRSFVKTTGGKGLHVVVPIRPHLAWDEVKEVTRLLAHRLVKAAPDRYTSNMAKARRRGKIFVDYLRNGRGATAVAAYSTRARHGASVSLPVEWTDLDSLEPSKLTIRTVPELVFRRKRDPWADFASTKQTLTKTMLRALSR